MILQPGHWLGRGSVLVEGFSLGKTVECDARIEQDEAGLIVSGELKFQDGEKENLGVRIAGNDVGILFYEGGPAIISVFTNQNTGDFFELEATLGLIAEDIVTAWR